MATAKFSLFPYLPTELRLQIWHAALPDKLEQAALYYYKKGCWDPRHLTEADYDYDPDNDNLNLNFEFHHNRLDPLQIDVPLFYVNREARSSVLGWIREQDLKIRFCKDKQSLLFLRSFDVKRDTLYVSQDQWNEFICEPFDRIFEPDLHEKDISCPAPAFTRLAVPDALLWKEPDTLTELFDYYYGIEEVFVIVKAQPNSFWHEENNKNIKLKQWWELESSGMQGPTFYWNPDNDSFQWKDDSNNISDYPLYKVLDDAGPKLRTKLLEINRRRFEIRPAFAIRK